MEYIGHKIIIIGCSGSGKSVFARKLYDLTGIPLYHLDNIYWRADRTHLTNEEFDQEVQKILQKDQWILDGNYPRTYEIRIQACDTIIFLDYSKDLCLSGIKERVGKRHLDMPWIEEKLDQELVDIVENFALKKRPGLLKLLDKYADKQLIVFKDRKQSEEWLQNNYKNQQN